MVVSNMEYQDFLFKDIKYINGADKDPKVTLKFSAKPIDGGPREDIKRKVPDLPHRNFRDVWNRLVEYWKYNIEELLSKPDGIDWDFDDIRIRQVKIKWRDDGKPELVKYYSTIQASFDEKETVPTPYIQPSVNEGELEDIEALCNAAQDFLHGERDQTNLFDNAEDEVDEEQESDDDSDNNRVDLSEAF